MALPTIDDRVGAPLPDDHSIEAHLEAERVVLARERLAAAKPAVDPRWTLVRSVGLGLALAGTIAIGWNHTHGATAPRSCPADGYTLQDGTALHRDADCAWVGPDGKPVPVDADGRPVDR